MKLPKIHITGTTFINAGGALVIVYLLAVLIQTVKHNYELGQQINGLKTQISLLKDQETALNDSIAYYKTDSYRDRQARSQLGLQLPGENVVIIPNTQSTSPANPVAADSPTSPAQPSTVRQSNIAQWMNFLTGG